MGLGERVVEALEAVAAERPDRFDRSFACAEGLLAEWGEPELAERIVASARTVVGAEVTADLISILSWLTRDNGSAMTRSAEAWLRASDDPYKIAVALNLDVYPFLDRSMMETVLRQVAEQHPGFAARCEELIASRRVIGV